MAVERQSVVHMPAIVETAAVTEAMLSNDSSRAVHEAYGEAPAALVEIAGGARVMAGVGYVAAMCEAAYMPGLVAGRDEVGDHGLETGCKMAGDRDRSCRGCHRNHAAAAVYRGAVMLRKARLHLQPLARLSRAMVNVVRMVRMARAVRGAGVMMLGVMMMVLIVVMMVVPVSGFCGDRSGQKNSGRCE